MEDETRDLPTPEEISDEPEEETAPLPTAASADATGPAAEPPTAAHTAPPPATPAATAAAPRHSHGGPIAIAVALSLLVGTTSGAAGGYIAAKNGLDGVTKTSTQTTAQKLELVNNGSTDEIVSAVAAVAMPSVVSIQVTSTQSSNSRMPGNHPDVETESEGSGVAYKAIDGGGTYIITNNHVVDGATKITVTDANGDSYEGKVVGTDSEYDIAVVQVSASIPVVSIGDSDDLKVGQTVVAIGSPFGLKLSVTSGVISALHRAASDFGDTNGTYPYMDSIQTDAAINPGNSGGALLDKDGKLIGIPAAIYSESGGSEGIGLCIPVNRAVTVANALISGDTVQTPYLGIKGQDVTSDLVAEKNLPTDKGAYVAEVSDGTGAAKAGLKAGDVIVGIDDTTVRSMDDLILAVRQHSVGDSVTLTIYRDGAKTTLTMTLGAKPASTAS